MVNFTNYSNVLHEFFHLFNDHVLNVIIIIHVNVNVLNVIIIIIHVHLNVNVLNVIIIFIHVHMNVNVLNVIIIIHVHVNVHDHVGADDVQLKHCFNQRLFSLKKIY